MELWQNNLMKKFTFLFLFILVGCSEPEIPSHLLMENGGVFYEVGKKTPFNGATIKNKDGELFKKTFYSDGKMYKEIEFYSSGSTKQILQKNDNNILIFIYDEKGLDVSNSEWVNYYDNGFVKEKGKYLNGLKDDKWEYFHEDGELIQREYWLNGKKLPIMNFDNLIQEGNKFYENDISNDHNSNKKLFTGIVKHNFETQSYGINIYYLKITNGNIVLAESYDEETGFQLIKSTCISKIDDLDNIRMYRSFAFNCSNTIIYYPNEENEQIDKTTITKLGDNLWEYTWETTINNEVIYIEKIEYIANEGERLSYNPGNSGKKTFESAIYENGNIHTSTSLVNGEIEFKRFNKDGLDISNGEGLGIMAWEVIRFDPEFDYRKGKFKNGKPHGVWTNGRGDMTTYKNGIANGPFKSFWSKNCLWREGNNLDGYYEGELITYETSPRDNCGKVIKKVEVYYKGELKE